MRLLPAVAFATLVGLGAVVNLANPALLSTPEAEFWDGQWAAQYQDAFDEASPLLGTSRTVWGIIDWSLFRQGRPGVLVGRDGWLYSVEEFDVVGDPLGAVDAWVTVIVDVSRRLAQDDIVLVVALIPSKAAMSPDPAPAPLPEGAVYRYDRALSALHDRGVQVPDLRGALASAAEDGAVFLRTDTHWTPHGAEAAARAIAQAVRERAALTTIDSAEFVTETLTTEPLLGDLATFLDLGAFVGRLGPAPDPLEVRSTVSLEGPGDDLFAEVHLPVALVGTSYSADPRWNMAGALREALGADVHEAAVTGIGPLEPLERYLGSEAFERTPPEIVVWEIPERYLTLEGYVPWGEER